MPDPWFKCECGWQGNWPDHAKVIVETWPICPMCGTVLFEVEHDDCGDECAYRRGE